MPRKPRCCGNSRCAGYGLRRKQCPHCPLCDCSGEPACRRLPWHAPTGPELLQPSGRPRCLWHLAVVGQRHRRARQDRHHRRVACLRDAPGPKSTNIFQDVSAFDSYFHLPPVKLTVVPGTAPKALADLAIGEEVEDVEMVHTVAPGAAIRVVMTGPRTYSAGAALSDLRDVVSASSGADVVSMSGGAWEDCFTPAQLTEAHSLISQLIGRHLTVTASTGDAGVADVTCGAPVPLPKRGVQYPASDPLVLAVGGTMLVANPTTGSYISETAWNSPRYGSTSGGFSRSLPAPRIRTVCMTSELIEACPMSPATPVPPVGWRSSISYLRAE